MADPNGKSEEWGAWSDDITASDMVKVEMGSNENDEASATDFTPAFANNPVGEAGKNYFEVSHVKEKKKKKRKAEKQAVEHICSTCGKKFRDRHKLVIHERIHTGEFFSCVHCTRKFRDKYKLSYHMKHTHHDTTTPTKSLEVSESAITKEKKPSQCNVCFKEFKYASNLRDHMKSHSEERPEMCEVCGKRFKIKQVLKLHMQLHDEKRHQCELCDAKFQSRSGLWEHRWTHTKEKPFKCNLCSASFKWKVRLKCHMKMHDGSNLLPCGWCEKVFPRKWMLRSHVERKHAARASAEAPVA